jgi:hypothetical protein
MMAEKKRGRPPSTTTLEMRRMEAMLKSMPEHIPKLTEAQKSMLDESFAHNEKIRQEILKTFKHGRTTPDDHAYAMASIGDESLIGHEQEILDADDEYKYRAKRYRESGTSATRNKNSDRKASIKKINQVLISKIRPNGRFTVHRVALMIYDQWDSMLPSDKFHGEESLTSRGDGDKRPGVSTIGRWIES